MITENYNDYKDGGTHKEFTLSVVGEQTEIGNTNLMSESIKLEEALCSENNLRFGCCEASQFTAQIANEFTSLEGKYIDVSVEMDDAVTKYGTFKIVSDKPTADRIWRVIKGYDKMYDILNADVLEWYNGLTFPMTLKNFRDSFFTYLGITQETVTLINDSFQVQQGFSATGSLSGKTIITAICEFNGVFGHINRDGNFEYVSLDGASSFNCPPYENNSVTYEDYVTEAITKVTMRGTASDVGTSVGVDGNEYIITNNPLIYGTEGTQALTAALTNLLNKISQITFRPFSLGKTIGNPCVELGDAISILTKYQTIDSYVIKRVLSGIQALRDSYSATGDRIYPKEVNTIQSQINRLQGKTNELTRTVDQTVSTLTRVEQIAENAQETADGLADDIQTANNNASTALTTANNANNTAVTVQSQFQQMADQIVMKVDANGNVVKVALSADASAGSNVLIKGDNIQLDGNVTITSGFTLTAGLIQSANYVPNKSGMLINLNDGTINLAGNITLNDAIKFHMNISTEYGDIDDVFNFVEVVTDSHGWYSGIKLRGYGGDVLHTNELVMFEGTVGGNEYVPVVLLDSITFDCDVRFPHSVNLSSATGGRILVSDSNKNIVSSSLSTSDLITTSNIGSQSVNYATSAGTANAIGIVATNEVRFTKMSSAMNLYVGYKWSDNTKSALIKRYRFCNGDGDNLAPITASLFEGPSESVKDAGNNSSNTTFAYSKSALSYSDYTYLAAWNGYELRAVNKSQFAQAGTVLEKGSGTYTWNSGGGNSYAWFDACKNGSMMRNIAAYENYWDIKGPIFISNGVLELFHSTPAIDFHFNNSSADYTARIIELSSGKLTVYNTISNGSDKRLKKDIVDMNDKYLRLLDLVKPKEYRFKKGDSYLNLGFIAQDVENAMKEIGITDMPLVTPPANNEDYYALDYNGLIPVLWKQCAELKRQINELKNSNTFYQNIINTMQAEIEELKLASK